MPFKNAAIWLVQISLFLKNARLQTGLSENKHLLYRRSKREFGAVMSFRFYAAGMRKGF
jgi:hypothetical protein